MNFKSSDMMNKMISILLTSSELAQSRQNLRCSLIQAVSQEEPSDRKLDP